MGDRGVETEMSVKVGGCGDGRGVPAKEAVRRAIRRWIKYGG
jgi:hypothetical protein